MKYYPEIYILGRMVNGIFVEWGAVLYRTYDSAELEAFGLNANKDLIGKWKVTKYGRPRTVGE